MRNARLRTLSSRRRAYGRALRMGFEAVGMEMKGNIGGTRRRIW